MTDPSAQGEMVRRRIALAQARRAFMGYAGIGAFVILAFSVSNQGGREMAMTSAAVGVVGFVGFFNLRGLRGIGSGIEGGVLYSDSLPWKGLLSPKELGRLDPSGVSVSIEDPANRGDRRLVIKNQFGMTATTRLGRSGEIPDQFVEWLRSNSIPIPYGASRQGPRSDDGSHPIVAARSSGTASQGSIRETAVEVLRQGFVGLIVVGMLLLLVTALRAASVVAQDEFSLSIILALGLVVVSIGAQMHVRREVGPSVSGGSVYANKLPWGSVFSREQLGRISPRDVSEARLMAVRDHPPILLIVGRKRQVAYFHKDEDGEEFARALRWLDENGITPRATRDD